MRDFILMQQTVGMPPFPFSAVPAFVGTDVVQDSGRGLRQGNTFALDMYINNIIN
jgi:hypothetical protein